VWKDADEATANRRLSSTLTRKTMPNDQLINLDEVRCVKSSLNYTSFFFNKPDQLPNVQFNFHLKTQSVRDSNYEPGLAQ
jgi:hypothetical protein